MPLITSAGIGSGLDLESIISATISAENTPKMNAFVKKEESLQVELSALGEVKSALSKLQDTIEKLADPDNFDKRIANIKQPTSDDGDLISVTPTSDITPGDFNIEVIELAQGVARPLMMVYFLQQMMLSLLLAVHCRLLQVTKALISLLMLVRH